MLTTAERWLGEGRRVAWATVVSTWRSSPRPVGSQMVITDDARFEGSVSGGCVEGAVVEAALATLDAGSGRVLRYGVSSETAWDVGLPCGGKIEVFLAPAPPAIVARLAALQRGRSRAACVSDLERGEQALWESDSDVALLQLGPALAARVRDAVEREASQVIEEDGRRLFVHVIAAPPRLVVVGAVHLTQALAPLAEMSGFELIIVDPRTAFATPERFPSTTLLHDWPDEALAALRLDRSTAVVVLSHDAKLDEPALEAALRSDCFYVGALGSRRTQDARRRRLAEAGFDDAALARIHGPVGLDIGAVTTAEMAIAIMAEIIAARRGPRRAGSGAEAAGSS